MWKQNSTSKEFLIKSELCAPGISALNSVSWFDSVLSFAYHLSFARDRKCDAKEYSICFSMNV